MSIELPNHDLLVEAFSFTQDGLNGLLIDEISEGFSIWF